MRYLKDRKFCDPESHWEWDLKAGESIREGFLFVTVYTGDASIPASALIHKSVAAELGRYLIQLAGESE